MKFLIVFLLCYTSLFGCSRVFWNDDSSKIVIRSMDLNRADDAKLVVFPRGYERHGGVESDALTWRSKYGSVVTTAFNMGASDGMNEKGLSAHLQYLDGTDYSSNSQLPKIGTHLWIQYFLDNCANIKEVIAIADTFEVVNLEIAGEQWPLFAILEDVTGETAILEYIDGKLHIHHGYAFNVATNDPFYASHLQNLVDYLPFGGILPIPNTQDSSSRFVRAAAHLERISPTLVPYKKWQEIVNIVKIIEKSADESWRTLWFTICDLQHSHYYFLRTADRSGFMIDLKRIDFSEGNSALQINPYDPYFKGNISALFSG